jgi:hypothetical protein
MVQGEPPCLSADRDTSFDNDKRYFQFNGLIVLIVIVLTNLYIRGGYKNGNICNSANGG